MAVNEAVYRVLLNNGIPHPAALVLADPLLDPIVGTTVADPAAIASTAPGAAYVQAEATAVRSDLVALRATVLALTTALRTAGVIA